MYKIMAEDGEHKQKESEIADDKVLMYKGRFCVSKDKRLRK